MHSQTHQTEIYGTVGAPTTLFQGNGINLQWTRNKVGPWL
jgi:hypothetical protein